MAPRAILKKSFTRYKTPGLGCFFSNGKTLRNSIRVFFLNSIQKLIRFRTRILGFYTLFGGGGGGGGERLVATRLDEDFSF